MTNIKIPADPGPSLPTSMSLKAHQQAMLREMGGSKVLQRRIEEWYQDHLEGRKIARARSLEGAFAVPVAPAQAVDLLPMDIRPKPAAVAEFVFRRATIPELRQIITRLEVSVVPTRTYQDANGRNYTVTRLEALEVANKVLVSRKAAPTSRRKASTTAKAKK